ncbi:MAG: OsmC family protein [Candidatus Bathyarchaeum sp.]|nr:MAG: OsmC family protein [Candidatus Bathyarchaeum sp.]
MTKVSLTYDGFQHATALQEERENARGKTVATDCPYTGKGEEFSPLELTGTGVAGCCLISMGTLAMRREIDISGTRLDVELAWTKKMDRIGSIDFTFYMAKNYSDKERMMLERAADACPIKHSFHPDTKITVQFIYPK